MPAYEGRLRVKERRHPKLYWTDAGIVRALRHEFHPPGEIERGALFEGWVANLLRAYGDSNSALGLSYDAIYYWAPAQSANEVDFLIQRGKEFIAIEAKAKETLSNRDFMGLKTIAELKGIKRRIVVFFGERSFQTENGIEALPVNKFIKELEMKKI